MKKGISLSINTVVIIGLALIVMIALILFFSSVFNPSASEVSKQSVLRACCTRIAGNCEAYINGDKSNDEICTIPEYMRDEFEGKEKVPIDELARKVGVDAKEFCGC